ncbi:hypothetical protein GYMLUDRAFT_33806 [Collybiopsis luxurians FD-317 M1]|nr:hypothetical protein GYMLUDRAFT_33806 [Collybiopsis luxurians FD-317 M1]
MPSSLRPVRMPPPLSATRARHRKCTLVNYSPFGYLQSCMARHFLQISSLITNCQAYLPTLDLDALTSPVNVERFQSMINQHFSDIPIESSPRFYVEYVIRIKQLQAIEEQLSAARVIQSKFSIRIKHHGSLPSGHIALMVFQNLRLFKECATERKMAYETRLWTALDEYPNKAEAQLRCMMNQVLANPELVDGRLPFLSYSNFRTLGMCGRLDSEIVDYFVKKWCSSSGTTLGLSSLFACKILFQQDTRTTARQGFLIVEDEREVMKWCRQAQKDLNLDAWDSVSIPINEDGAHWFSAYIDFRSKRIDIFDSLEETCVLNRQKPILLRKNAQLMLMSIPFYANLT